MAVNVVKKLCGQLFFRVWSKRSRLAWTATTLLLLASACKKDERAPVLDNTRTEVPFERLPETSAAFETTRCPQRVPGRSYECGYVTAALSPGSDESVKIRIARIFSDADEPRDDPIVYLDGGPGAASIEGLASVAEFLSEPVGDRDLILVDQRGTGGSIPNLDCPLAGETEEEYIGNCFERLSDKLDLNQVRTANIVDDLEAVRKALGYDEWNLWGISYGTRVALTAMRDHPEGLRSVVIDSVVPLQSDLLAEVGANGYDSLVKIFGACQDDLECGLAYPDSEADLKDVVLKLQAEPYESENGAIVTSTLFINVLFNLAYSPSSLVFIPRLIESAKDDDYRFFTQVSEGVGGGIAFGMHLAVQCSEEMPFHTPETFEQYDAMVPLAFRADLSGESYLDFCKWFKVDAAEDVENLAVKSDVNTLVIAGEFDPITPPAFAELVAQDLESSAELVIIENESHGASVVGCGARVMRNFLDAPTDELKDGCLTSLPDLRFAGAQGGESLKYQEKQLHFITSDPSEEELAETLKDLKRRLNHL